MIITGLSCKLRYIDPARPSHGSFRSIQCLYTCTAASICILHKLLSPPHSTIDQCTSLLMDEKLTIIDVACPVVERSSLSSIKLLRASVGERDRVR
jgi:hypothetical protein